MTTLERIAKDARVEEVGDETSSGDGYWVYLKPGYRDGLSECHAVHEWTIKSLIGAFRFVEPCNCADCKPK